MEVLSEITEAENKSDELVEKARQKAEQMIKDADISSRETMDEKKDQIERKNIEKIEKLKKQIEEKKNKKLEEVKITVADIKKKATSKNKKAVDYIYNEFLKTVNKND